MHPLVGVASKSAAFRSELDARSIEQPGWRCFEPAAAERLGGDSALPVNWKSPMRFETSAAGISCFREGSDVPNVSRLGKRAPDEARRAHE